MKDLWQKKKGRGWAEQGEVPSSRTQEHEIEYVILDKILIRCARNFSSMGLGGGRMYAHWTCHANGCELAMNRERRLTISARVYSLTECSAIPAAHPVCESVKLLNRQPGTKLCCPRLSYTMNLRRGLWWNRLIACNCKM